MSDEDGGDVLDRSPDATRRPTAHPSCRMSHGAEGWADADSTISAVSPIIGHAGAHRSLRRRGVILARSCGVLMVGFDVGKGVDELAQRREGLLRRWPQWGAIDGRLARHP